MQYPGLRWNWFQKASYQKSRAILSLTSLMLESIKSIVFHIFNVLEFRSWSFFQEFSLFLQKSRETVPCMWMLMRGYVLGVELGLRGQSSSNCYCVYYLKCSYICIYSPPDRPGSNIYSHSPIGKLLYKCITIIVGEYV